MTNNKNRKISKHTYYADMTYICPKCYKSFIIDIKESVEINVRDDFFNYLDPIDHIYHTTTMNCSNCGSTIVDIDRNIIKDIIVLNSKNFFTETCCGGHEKHLYPYISFKPGVELPLLSDGSYFIPEGWIIERNPFVYFNISKDGIDSLIVNKTTITSNGDKNDIIELKKWVKSLYVNKNIELDSDGYYNPGEKFEFECTNNEGFMAGLKKEDG